MKTKKLVILALFITLEIILTRYLSITTPIVRIGFTFLPICLSAIIFGPLTAGLTAALADVIGFMLNPFGVFFPGFTLSAFVTGFIYGMILYKKEVTFIRTSLACIIISIFVYLGLDTLWVWILTKDAIFGLLPIRITKAMVLIPVQIVTIMVTWKYLSHFIEKHVMKGLN